ncbi:MAG: HAD hydrolase-like protein [Pseudonocardiales bacterium]|nr:HAD hydrolase-like protein [Pseudonocardiales bacterium]
MLISVDVGGTLGHVEGLSLAAILAAASPLDPHDARRIVRHKLHTAAEITDTVREEICSALEISPSSFPTPVSASPLRLLPDAVDTLRRLNDYGIVITLSNVTCVEADTEELSKLLTPWVTAHFPSYQLGYATPDPRVFRMVAAHYHVDVRHLVHIGDDWECDILGATAVGATAIWISGGRSVPDDQPRVGSRVLVTDDLGQITQHVRTFARSRS